MMTLISDVMNRLMGRLTCRETLELLQQHLDGELPADQTRRVAEHLDHCRLCNAESDIYEQIKQAIMTSGVADPDVVQRLERFGERVGNGEIVD
ncbi:MAG: zf-HC2 domain-containing protein [Acidimicrobiales bacterium]|nr:zf-HC2 domain-containing protein [Acidimicrobiales bacterium]